MCFGSRQRIALVTDLEDDSCAMHADGCRGHVLLQGFGLTDYAAAAEAQTLANDNWQGGVNPTDAAWTIGGVKRPVVRHCCLLALLACHHSVIHMPFL